MHAASIITFLLPSIVMGVALPGHDDANDSLTKRECHGSGVTWGQNKPYALSLATQACQQSFIPESGSTKQAEGAQFHSCHNLDSTYKVDFTITWGTGDYELTTQACSDGLRKEIDGCDHGGRSGSDIVFS